MKKVSAVLLLILVSLLLGSCSSVHTQTNPKIDLSKFHRFYIEHRLTDDHFIDELIVAELRAHGFTADAGPLTMMPRDTDALVTYVDTWAWDFKSYLLQLDVIVSDARKEQALATGTYRQPTVLTKSPAEVVHVILTPLFKRS